VNDFDSAVAAGPRLDTRRWHTACNLTMELARQLKQSVFAAGLITMLARGASDEFDTAVALPLTAVSSQNVIGSFEARFFAPRWECRSVRQ
jgi:hypothetical protein